MDFQSNAFSTSTLLWCYKDEGQCTPNSENQHSKYLSDLEHLIEGKTMKYQPTSWGYLEPVESWTLVPVAMVFIWYLKQNIISIVLNSVAPVFLLFVQSQTGTLYWVAWPLTSTPTLFFRLFINTVRQPRQAKWANNKHFKCAFRSAGGSNFRVSQTSVLTLLFVILKTLSG